MKKIYLDTNVILDLLLDREPFSEDIAEIMELSSQKSIELCVSSVTISDTTYIVEKFEGIRSARQKIKMILELVTVENVGQSTIKKASESLFKDFEDGVQNFCAVESKQKIIVTRDIKGFKQSKLSILSPKEVLVKVNARN